MDAKCKTPAVGSWCKTLDGQLVFPKAASAASKIPLDAVFFFACHECMPFFVTLAETNVADFLLKIDPSWMVGKLNHFPEWHFLLIFKGELV